MKKGALGGLGGLVSVGLLVGCCYMVYVALLRKPYNYDIPEKIEPYETAFLIPLEGDTTNQAIFRLRDSARVPR